MKLLEAEKVKTEKDKSEEEKKARIRKLYEEETAASQRLNEVKTRVESEIEKLNDELREAEDLTRVRLHDLNAEVSSLESRRREALKPIRDREILLNKAEDAFKIKEFNFQKKEEELDERIIEVRQERDNFIKQQKELEIKDLVIQEKDHHLAREKIEHERYYQTREKGIIMDQNRLRRWFETENAIIDKKLLMLKKQNG